LRSNLYVPQRTNNQRNLYVVVAFKFLVNLFRHET